VVALTLVVQVALLWVAILTLPVIRALTAALMARVVLPQTVHLVVFGTQQ